MSTLKTKEMGKIVLGWILEIWLDETVSGPCLTDSVVGRVELTASASSVSYGIYLLSCITSSNRLCEEVMW
jgi:hypothetical protein